MNYIEIAALVIIVWNLIVFIMYGIDKQKAKRNKRRISEKALLLSAAFMGGIGAFVGMNLFRHKTKHLKFMVGVPLLLILNVAILIGIILCFM